MNIYVGNLASRVTEDQIERVFRRFGQVARVRIVMDHETNRSRGYAFVEMPSAQEANQAIAVLSQRIITPFPSRLT